MVLFKSIFTTVESGTYHIKQAAITGEMSAKMIPGMYGLFFGSKEKWPKSETYFFTKDKDTADDIDEDLSIRAQFKDGSIVWISGTVRIVLPSDKQDAINAVTEFGYRTYESLKDKHVLPILRKAVRNTASLMTAQESYATKRTDFQVWAADQLENGMYILLNKIQKVKVDESCVEKCEFKDVQYKIIKTGVNGAYVREPNAFIPGLKVLNLEVKTFEYSKKVRDQIASQQDAMMMVQTAIANTKKAEQQKIEQEALGKKAVKEAEYRELEEKIKAIVQAERDKKVAELAGEKRRNVAQLDKEAAAFKKQEQILLGEGEAKRKKLVMTADGALKQKLDAWIHAQTVWAAAYQKRSVPSYYIASGNKTGGNPDMQSQQFMSFINAMMAKQLGLNMSIKK